MWSRIFVNYRRLLAVLLLCGLGACSPTFNWRSVPLADLGGTALLPCKPERAEREVALTGQPVLLRMLACDAGGATFALAWAALPEGVAPDAALAHWRAATLAHIDASAPALLAEPQPPGGLPALVRLQAEGQRANGVPVTLQAVWTARRVGAQTYAVQAALYSAKAEPVLADTFFESLRWP